MHGTNLLPLLLPQVRWHPPSCRGGPILSYRLQVRHCGPTAVVRTVRRRRVAKVVEDAERKGEKGEKGESCDVGDGGDGADGGSSNESSPPPALDAAVSVPRVSVFPSYSPGTLCDARYLEDGLWYVQP